MNPIERREATPDDIGSATTRRRKREPLIEILHPGDFYAAYIFDLAGSREEDVSKVIQHASQLGYSMRYWWLSKAMDLQGTPDRLIVCVHHPRKGQDTGMDLYQALLKGEASWDELESAVMEEYLFLGSPLKAAEEITQADGSPLFSPDLPVD